MKVNFPELERIKILCKKLNEKVDKIELKIEKREAYFDAKSDNWQSSKKGQDYEYYTDHLSGCSEYAQEQIQNILDAVEELENQTK